MAACSVRAEIVGSLAKGKLHLGAFWQQETEDALAVASNADLIGLAKSSQRLFHVEQLPLRVWNRRCRLRFQSGHVGQDWLV